MFICLTIFFKDCSAAHIKFEQHNKTAVGYINHMGGCKSVACDTVDKSIWEWFIPKRIWLTAVYIPGPTNAIADSLSRTHVSDHEWQLSKEIFQKITTKIPHFSIDLFAYMLNTPIDRYASWHPDANASIVDAFSLSWEKEYLYEFPPFCLIPKCRGKISSEQAEGLLMVPAWPTQTWYPILLQMLIQQPALLIWTTEVKLLNHPLGKVHSMENKLKLMVCPVSRNTTKARAFLNTLPMYSSIHSDLLHKNSVRFILKNGIYSVVKGRLIQISPR